MADNSLVAAFNNMQRQWLEHTGQEQMSMPIQRILYTLVVLQGPVRR